MNEIKIKVKNGYLRATPSPDPNYPGIDVEYIADDDTGKNMSRPRVLIEYPQADDCNIDTTLRALIWNDPQSEDYTEEVELL